MAKTEINQLPLAISVSAPNDFIPIDHSNGDGTYTTKKATLGSLASLSSVNNSNWSGTALALANGGTGQTTASAAFNALSPMTAAGDIVFGGTGGAGTRLPAGTSSQALFGGAVPSWAKAPLLIDSPITYQVNHDGSGDFADLNALYLELSKRVIANTYVIAQLDAGVHNYSTFVSIYQQHDKFIRVFGANPIPVNVTSIASSSGSAGAWSVVLNVSSTAGIAAGMYAVISAASGGVNPTYIEGCWPITAAGSGTITIASTHRAAVAPSGAVAASVSVLSTILNFTGCDGFRIWNGHSMLNIGNVVLVGDGTTDPAWGVNLQDLGKVYFNGPVGMYGFSIGIYFNQNTQIDTDYPIAISACHGTNFALVADLGAVIQAAHLIVSGNAYHGALSQDGAMVRGSTELTVSGNGGVGITQYGGGFKGGILNATGNGLAGSYSGEGSQRAYFTTYNFANNSTGTAGSDYSPGTVDAYGDCWYRLFNATTSGDGYPAFTSTQDQTSGMNVGSGYVGHSVAGVRISTLNATGLGVGAGVTATALITAGAGTATVPPLRMLSGTNLTTPVAGATEYDGHALYFDPVAGVAGVIPVLQRSSVTASGGVALNNDANAQSFLPSGARNFPVQSGQLYRFRAKLLLSLGTSTTCVKNFLFALAGGAAFSWIDYLCATEDTTSANGEVSPTLWHNNVATEVAISATGTNQYVFHRIEGEFATSAAGTVQPQIQFSAAPGGTNINMRGSYFELYCEGPNAATVGLT